MKNCPKCGTTYTDETLRFCLADGNLLETVSDEQITIARPSVNNVERTVAMNDRTVRVDIPTMAAIPASAKHTAPAQENGGRLLKILFVVVGLAIAAGLAVVGGGIIYYAATRSDGPPSNYNSQITLPSPAPTEDEQAELREQIANLEKRLNEQIKSGQNSNTPLKMPSRSATTTKATVNSPGDGFLALRSLPSSQTGDRLLKIPHGATVTIGACGPVVTPVKRSGRWCQASYGGYDGWVFDSYLKYQ